MNERGSEQAKPDWRPRIRLTWVEVFLALCVLGAAAELLWGDKILDWLEGGRISRDRASIIASYYRNVEAGLLLQPAASDAFEIYHVDKNSPDRMAVRVRTQTGDTHRYEVVRSVGGSGTN